MPLLIEQYFESLKIYSSYAKLRKCRHNQCRKIASLAIKSDFIELKNIPCVLIFISDDQGMQFTKSIFFTYHKRHKIKFNNWIVLEIDAIRPLQYLGIFWFRLESRSVAPHSLRRKYILAGRGFLTFLTKHITRQPKMPCGYDIHKINKRNILIGFLTQAI